MPDLGAAALTHGGIRLEVPGSAQFVRDLRKVSKDLGKEMGQANKAVAQGIVDEATAKARGLGSTAAKAAGMGALKASARADAVQVILGSNSIPYALGAEFGGGAKPSTRQFKPHLGRTGYFLYPTIRSRSDQTLEEYGKAVDRLTAMAFPD